MPTSLVAALALSTLAAAPQSAPVSGIPLVGRDGVAAWSSSPRVEVDNLKMMVARPAAASLLAEHPALALIATFDRYSAEHCGVAGAMDESLMTVFESTPRYLEQEMVDDPALEARLIEMIDAAYRKATPKAAAAARTLASRTLAGVRDGTLDRRGLLDTAARLKLFDLYGAAVSEDVDVRAVHDMAARARAEDTMAGAKRIAAELLSQARPVEQAPAAASAVTPEMRERTVAVRMRAGVSGMDVTVLQLRYGLELIEKRSDGVYVFHLARDGYSQDDASRALSAEPAVDSASPLAAVEP